MYALRGRPRPHACTMSLSNNLAWYYFFIIPLKNAFYELC